MYQQEIKFFWPLTEQIPLELDYTGCEPPKMSCSVSASGNYTTWANPYPTGTITINAGNLQIDTESTVIITKQNPPLYRRVLYKLMGVKWSLK
jgi:hypothetical protein